MHHAAVIGIGQHAHGQVQTGGLTIQHRRRAQLGVAKDQQRGRAQLHIHFGRTLGVVHAGKDRGTGFGHGSFQTVDCVGHGMGAHLGDNIGGGW